MGILGSAPFPTKTSACIETAGRTSGASSSTTFNKAVITAEDTPSSAAAASVNVRPEASRAFTRTAVTAFKRSANKGAFSAYQALNTPNALRLTAGSSVFFKTDSAAAAVSVPEKAPPVVGTLMRIPALRREYSDRRGSATRLSAGVCVRRRACTACHRNRALTSGSSPSGTAIRRDF